MILAIARTVFAARLVPAVFFIVNLVATQMPSEGSRTLKSSLGSEANLHVNTAWTDSTLLRATR